MIKKFTSALLLVVIFTACSFTPPTTGTEVSGPTMEPVVLPSGSVLFQDSFENPASGWERVNSADGMMDYNGGIYRMLVNAKNYNMWAAPGKTFNDVRIEVDVVTMGGPVTNRAGIVCRVKGYDLYFFVITNDGYYAVGKTFNEKFTILGQNTFAQSSAIKTGLAINHLRADCVGSTLSFYVNGFLVSQVTDTSFTSGEAGVTAGTFEETGVDIVFDDFIVLQP